MPYSGSNNITPDLYGSTDPEGNLTLRGSTSVRASEVQLLEVKDSFYNTILTVPNSTLGSGDTILVTPTTTDSDLQTALESITAIGSGNVTVVASGAIGSIPTQALGYISSPGTNQIFAVILSNLAVDKTIDLPGTPGDIIIAPDGKIGYALTPGVLVAFDVASGITLASVEIGSGDGRLSVRPDSQKVYVTNTTDNSVSVVDVASFSVDATVFVGTAPVGLACSTDNSKVYVANSLDDTISVIQTSDNSIANTVTGMTGAIDVAYDPAGVYYYVGSVSDGIFKQVVADDSTAANFTEAYPISQLTISPDGVSIYHVDSTVSGYVVKTAASDGAVGFSIPVTSPIRVAVIPDSTKILVTDLAGNLTEYEIDFTPVNGEQTLSALVDASTATVTMPDTPLGSGNTFNISVGDDASTIADALAAVSAVGSTSNVSVSANTVTTAGKAYISSYNENIIYVVDLSDNSTITTISVASKPNMMAITPDGSKILVACGDGDSAVTIDTSTDTVLHTQYHPGANKVTIATNGQGWVGSNGDFVRGINMSTGIENAQIHVGPNVTGMAASSDGLYVYFGTDDTSSYTSFSRLEVSTGTVTPYGSTYGGGSLALSPDNSTLYINCAYTGFKTWDTATMTKTHDWSGTSAYGGTFYVSPDGATLYGLEYYNGIRVWDIATHSLTRTIGLSHSPNEMQLSADGNTAYCACDDAMVIVDLPSHSVTSTTTIANTGRGIAVTAGPSVYTADITFIGALADTHIDDLTTSSAGWTQVTIQSGNNGWSQTSQQPAIGAQGVCAATVAGPYDTVFAITYQGALAYVSVDPLTVDQVSWKAIVDTLGSPGPGYVVINDNAAVDRSGNGLFANLPTQILVGNDPFTLSSGSVEVADTRVTSSSQIIPNMTSTSANSGVVTQQSVSAGSGFALVSSNAADDNTGTYLIIG